MINSFWPLNPSKVRAAGLKMLSAQGSMGRVALITNQPAPYRTPVFDLAVEQGLDLTILYCCRREMNREWEVPETKAPHVFLAGAPLRVGQKYIHLNFGVLAALKRIRPTIVVTSGFQPTHLLAFLWAKVNGARHVPMTDGTLESEANLTWVHKALRHWIFGRSSAYVAASDGGLALYDSYSAPKDLQFKSCLAIDNDHFRRPADVQETHDLMFCGRLEEVKRPMFVLDVAHEIAVRRGRTVRVLMIGAGSLEGAIRARAEQIRETVDVAFAGFVQQRDLPRYYWKAKILLVPSTWEPWGLVVNEGLAAGLFVMATPEVGAAKELLRTSSDGKVLEADPAQWAETAIQVLDMPSTSRVDLNRDRLLIEYTFARAAAALVSACRLVQRKRVAIVQRRLTHYRVPFFNELRDKLNARNIELELWHGEPTPSERKKRDGGQLNWARQLKTEYLFGSRLCWHELPPSLATADMVICPHESGLALTHRLLMRKGRQKFAFWGHGRNFQGTGSHLSEFVKRWEAPRADWWFAYTELSREHLTRCGVPSTKISVVNNSVAADSQITVDRSTLPRSRRAVFLGSLHAEKKVDFLVRSCDLVADRCEGFELVCVGAGPEQERLTEMARARPWLRMTGPLVGNAKAEVLATADVMVCPGMVGLNIVDAFHAGLPLITTRVNFHSPEIAYLEDGVNGLMSAATERAYADALVRVMTEPELLQRLQRGAKAAGEVLTLSNMVNGFAAGIVACLEEDGSRT